MKWFHTILYHFNRLSLSRKTAIHTKQSRASRLTYCSVKIWFRGGGGGGGGASLVRGEIYLPEAHHKFVSLNILAVAFI